MDNALYILVNKRIFKQVSQREGQGFSQQTHMLMKEPQPYMNKALNNEKLGAHSSVNDSGKASIMLPQPYLSNDPFRRPVFPNHREFPESELNKDIHNRQLIMLHGQDIEHQHKSQGKVSALPVGESLGFSKSSLPETTDDWMAAFPGIAHQNESSFYSNQDNPALTAAKLSSKDVSREVTIVRRKFL